MPYPTQIVFFLLRWVGDWWKTFHLGFYEINQHLETLSIDMIRPALLQNQKKGKKLSTNDQTQLVTAACGPHVWHFAWTLARRKTNAKGSKPEVAGVTFSYSDSAPVTKFLNPGPDPCPAIFQIRESDSCSDSGYNHKSNLILPMFLLKKWPHRLLLVPKLKRDSGSGFSQLFDSGSERKTQNPAGVVTGAADPVPSLE